MPSQLGSYFGNTVTYICEHSARGAMGIMINRPTDLPLAELLKQHGQPPTDDDGIYVLEGGPVEKGRGFVLHTSDVKLEESLTMSDTLSLTSSRSILNAIGDREGPSQYLVALGYSGWGPGQLEDEMQEGVWLSCPADERVLFDVLPHDRLDAVAALLDIDLRLLVPRRGEA